MMMMMMMIKFVTCVTFFYIPTWSLAFLAGQKFCVKGPTRKLERFAEIDRSID